MSRGAGHGRRGVADADLGQAWSLFCAGRPDDPYPAFAALRERDPIHWSEVLDAWVLTRYGDVYSSLADVRLGSDRIAAYMGVLPTAARREHVALGEHIGGWLGFTDPPRHTRLRALVREEFTPKLALQMRPAIEGIVADRLDAMAGRGEAELVGELAFPLPASVICAVLGMGDEQLEEMKSLTDAIVPFTANIGPSLVGVAGPAHEAVDRLLPVFSDLMQTRLRSPTGDLLSRLAFLVRDGHLTQAEALSLVVFTFVAGFETTTSGIANALYLLLTAPEQRARLAADPALAVSMVDETLRMESPIQMLVRTARADVAMEGRTIQQGSTVILLQGAGNRDARQFPGPDALDVGRTPNRHLAFGWANHFCLGAPLARLEIEVATMAFLKRFPRASLRDETIDWIPTMSIRRPVRLVARLY